MCRNLDLRFLPFYCLLSKFFSRPFSLFFVLAFYCLFSFYRIGFYFYRPSFSLFFFRHCFIPISLAHVVSALAYPNLLGTKRLGCCCCCCCAIGPLELLARLCMLSIYWAFLPTSYQLSRNASALRGVEPYQEAQIYIIVPCNKQIK
jgi:hypothetical protein